SDKAQIEAAALQLSFAKITAPIGGQIGLRKVDVGNIVHASDPTGIAVITQLQPIAVVFTLPEDQLQTTMQAMRRGQLTADAYTRDDNTKIVSGTLLTVDNAIDPTTGTSRFKAIFQNQNRELWPNQFVNIHLLIEVKKNAITIPSAAIIRGSSGSLVYAVKPDGTVEARNVQVGVVEGATAQVESGLNPNDVVVTDGQDKLQNGAKVMVQPPAGQSPGRGNRTAQNEPGPSGSGGESFRQGQQAGSAEQSGSQSGQTGQPGATGLAGPGGQSFQPSPAGAPNAPALGIANPNNPNDARRHDRTGANRKHP
ncbi:MAG: multidrug transporter subunit MdtA, partial [Acidobacteriaceae bacterium]|nr:multidrug transporter subunit MdtA [Acidobacteriaceae bacterium]